MLDFSAKAQFDFLGWVSAGAVRLEPISANDLVRLDKGPDRKIIPHALI